MTGALMRTPKQGNTCGTCKFRGDSPPDSVHGAPAYFLCTLIKHQHVRYVAVPPGAGAFVCDGSDYYAALCVESDFGCNKWEPQNPTITTPK